MSRGFKRRQWKSRRAVLMKTAMTLSKAEFRRRMVAGLALYGLELSDLPRLLERYDDIPKHHPARMGRESDSLGPGSATATIVAKELGLPAGWFECESWADLIHGAELRPDPAEMGEAKRSAALAARAKQKARRKSARKQTAKARKRRVS
jgi:hypothetical protein